MYLVKTVDSGSFCFLKVFLSFFSQNNLFWRKTFVISLDSVRLLYGARVAGEEKVSERQEMGTRSMMIFGSPKFPPNYKSFHIVTKKRKKSLKLYFIVLFCLNLTTW